MSQLDLEITGMQRTRKMMEEYFIAREQYIKMEPPTLKARPSLRSLGLKTTSPLGNH